MKQINIDNLIRKLKHLQRRNPTSERRYALSQLDGLRKLYGPTALASDLPNWVANERFSNF